jgi:preprotein translocase subunit YajC
VKRPLPIIGLLVFSMACVPRDRLNASCHWANERLATAGEQHLISDAELAEELAIRFADTTRGRRSGHFAGVEVYAETREQCLASLLTVVGCAHGVDPEAIRGLIGRRPPGFDFSMLVSFALLYAIASFVAVRRLRARFRFDSPLVAAAATSAAALASSITGLMLFALWTAAGEMLRVRDPHLSYRVGRLPWSPHWAELFIAAVALFLIIDWLLYRRQRRSASGFSVL